VRVILTVLVLVFLFSGSCAVAQSPNASIRGIVLDPDAKSIPDAEIIVVNDATGVKYATSTNGDGIYALENLPPGTYRIQVSKFGFKGIIKPDLILNVQSALLLNFTLPVGASAVTVTVEGGAPMINTTDASVSTVVDRQFAENLPLNGRSFQSLIYLTPGVVATSSNSYDAGQFSVNGQRPASNYWMVDGVSANFGISTSSNPGNGLGGTLGSFGASGGTNSLVSVDALQEFRIQTSTFAPEFGRTPGGQISIVTRSGTNAFHGSAFDYLRNDVLDANNWFADSAELTKPRERQNDFGGTFSGPIAGDRTFFFFSYEGLRLRLPQTALTEVPDNAPSDPYSRQFAVPSMQPYLNAYPLPNGPMVLDGEGRPTGVAEFNASYSNPATLDAYSLRMDHQLNSKWNLFGRYNYSPSQYESRGGAGFLALSAILSSQITTQTFTVGATWNASHAVTNDLRFNYSSVDANGNAQLDNFAGAVALANVPFPSPYTPANGQFAFYIFGLGKGQGLEVGRSAENTQRQINAVDSLSWQKGAHSFKFGFDFRRLAPDVRPSQYYQEGAFHTVVSAVAGSSYFSEVFSQNNVELTFKNVGAYAQDSWRLRPGLTVTYGLRWDVDFAPASRNGINLPAVSGYSLIDLSQLAVAPPGTPPFRTAYGNIAPRVGVAYQFSGTPKWQTVLRTGFGVFYDLVSSEMGNAVAQAALFPPLGNRSYYLDTTFPLSSTQIEAPAIPSLAAISEITAFNPNLKLPYTLEWNVAIEQALGENQAISVSYIGASGRRLLQTTNLLSPVSNPDVSEAVFIDNTAASNYNGAQVEFKRRLSSGVQALASYTFSHSIDDGSAGSFGLSSNLSVPGLSNQNRGDSDFDIRHTFTMGLTYDLPSPHGGRFLKSLLGGWSTENLVIARSAPPVDVLDGNFDVFNSGVSAAIRPDVVLGQPLYLYGSQFPGGKEFNANAFADPPVDPNTLNPLRQGTLGRNALRGFGATQWDFAVHRDFHLRESLKLQFRAEMFNVVNHPNFGPPGNYFGEGGFGLSTQTLNQSLNGGSNGSNLGGGGFDPLYQIGGPRSIQLALKLSF
jgi:hypothetical protein